MTVKILIMCLSSSGVDYLPVSILEDSSPLQYYTQCKTEYSEEKQDSAKWPFQEEKLDIWGASPVFLLIFSIFPSDWLQQNLKVCWLQTRKFVVTTTHLLTERKCLMCKINKRDLTKSQMLGCCGVTKNFLIAMLSDLTRCCHCHSQLKSSHQIQQWQHLTR